MDSASATSASESLIEVKVLVSEESLVEQANSIEDLARPTAKWNRINLGRSISADAVFLSHRHAECKGLAILWASDSSFERTIFLLRRNDG